MYFLKDMEFPFYLMILFFLLFVDIIDGDKFALITRLEETKRKMNDRIKKIKSKYGLLPPSLGPVRNLV
jgi:hypothetical protein